MMYMVREMFHNLVSDDAWHRAIAADANRDRPSSIPWGVGMGDEFWARNASIDAAVNTLAGLIGPVGRRMSREVQYSRSELITWRLEFMQREVDAAGYDLSDYDMNFASEYHAEVVDEIDDTE